VRDIDEILDDLCGKRAELKELKSEGLRRSKIKSVLTQARRDQLAQDLEKQSAIVKAEIDAVVAELVRWPPHKSEHFTKLRQFFAKFDYSKSVFIMTKYPNDPPGPLDHHLQRVITHVCDAVKSFGYTPHLASDHDYHPELFRNIEVYMLGCSKAIAIVESKHTMELNPNVAMEWGWLRCTDRGVMYLVEKEFKLERADIGGLIKKAFNWDDPEPGIKAAVKAFLEGSAR